MSTNFKDWVVGSSVNLNGANNEEIMSAMSKAKIKRMELATDVNTYLNKLDFVNNSTAIREMADKYGIELWSIHLPFSGELDISWADERSDNTMKTHMALIPAAAKAGFKVAVVHPSSEPIKDEDRQARLDKSRSNLKILAEYAKSHNIRLAVEDLPRSCIGNHSDEIMYLLDGNPDLNVCFDLNHLLKQDNTEFAAIVNSRIITLHVSDYDFIDERHQLPFEGKTNWKSVITALENVNYNGSWIYEVRGGKTFDELYENYIQLSEL
jgi:Sugar phosphate isomerases/epimerases